MECRHFPDRSHLNNRLDNLSWGTKKQNAADKEVQGQSQRGERNRMAKLSAADVKNIRELCAKGAISQVAIGKLFGINQQTVSKIHRRKRWAHA